MNKIPYWLTVAIDELGEHEIAGDANNPRIQEYLSTVNLRDRPDEVPWCSAFVNWALQLAGVAGTGLANARSFETWGEPIKDIRRGAVVVIPRGKESWMGHVALVLDYNEDEEVVYLIGGNQRDRVSIMAVYKSKIIAVRWPKGE